MRAPSPAGIPESPESRPQQNDIDQPGGPANNSGMNAIVRRTTAALTALLLAFPVTGVSTCRCSDASARHVC